jgi:beta-alanine degradation protein BauB
VRGLRNGDRVNDRAGGKGESEGRKDEELIHDRTPFSVALTILRGAVSGVTEITGLRICAVLLRAAVDRTTNNPRVISNLGVKVLEGRRLMLKEEAERQIENPRARVTHHRMAPGASTGFHRHDYVIVPVTNGRMRVVEGGRESVNELTAGVSYFRKAGVEHDVINGGDRDLIFVEIELLP